MTSTSIKVKALPCKQNNETFFSTVLESSILKKMCFVARRDEEQIKGFQRVLNEARAKEIAKYLDENQSVIPSAILLSVQDNANFEFNDNTSEIVFKVVEKGFLVIDGQHRLYGLTLAKKSYEIPVIIFNGLNTKEEVGLFIDINTKQKGVPAALILDIKELAGRETKKEEKQKELFDKLNNNSVLAGFLSPHKSSTGKISRVTFNAATDEIFESSFFQDKSMDVIYQGVKNYLEAIDRVFIKSKSPRARLYSSVLFRAAFDIFNDVIEISLKDSGNLKVDSLELVLEPISKLNYDVYIGTNRTTIQRVISDMKLEIKQYNKLSQNSIDNLF